MYNNFFFWLNNLQGATTMALMVLTLHFGTLKGTSQQMLDSVPVQRWTVTLWLLHVV